MYLPAKLYQIYSVISRKYFKPVYAILLVPSVLTTTSLSREEYLVWLVLFMNIYVTLFFALVSSCRIST